MISHLLARFIWLSIHFSLFSILRLKSFFKHLIIWMRGKKKEVHVFGENTDHRKILIMALHQKKNLRKDLVRLLRVVKEKKFYVILVNTSSIANPQDLNELCDIYIERDEYGRDFSSYKLAFMLLYRKGMHETCERLIMLNDSVFYARNGLPEFIERLSSSDWDVVGATENFENYHIGSFCISMSGNILRENRFMKFWKKYKGTDVRPDVIRKGEVGLTRTICKILRREEIKLLYDISWFLSFMEQNPSIVEHAFEYSRKSDKIPSSPTLETELQRHFARNSIKGKILPYFHEMHNFDDLKRDILLRLFVRGSQIHQNALILFKGGLPIVKLDLLYRGVLDESDIYRLVAMMDPEDAEEFKKLVFARPFGRHNLFGLQRVYFEHGFI